MPFSLLEPVGRTPIAVVDTETTGASADFGHRVIELGIVRLENGVKVAEYQQLLDPQRRIGAGVTALTGISQEMVAGQPKFVDHLPQITALLRGAIVLGHNVRFDLSFLNKEFRRAGQPMPEALGPGVPVLDTVRIARRRFGRGGNGLGSLARRLGIKPVVAHRALADAQTTHLVFEQLLVPVGGWSLCLCDAYREQGGPMGLLPVTPRENPLSLELEEALEQRCPVLMVYLDARQRRTERVIEPLTIRRFNGELLLVAHCHLRQDRRTFKLERIVELRRIDGPIPTNLPSACDDPAEDTVQDAAEAVAEAPDTANPNPPAAADVNLQRESASSATLFPMSESYIQNLFADRIGGRGYGKGTEIYKFEKIKRAKRAALSANPGAELIDMGVGEPDEMAFPQCVEALYAAAKKAENRGYADNGAADFQNAAARWLKNVCGVSIENPASQVVHSIGSKAALSILPNCFINPGDVALMTTPGYPVFGTHAKYLGGEVYNLPLLEKNSFLPELASIPADKLKRAKTLVINYPNNPTGASATPKFFEEVVAFAKANNIVVIHDAAYAALVFDGKPLSFLATPGGLDVGVELHSMSKGFNMTGWRLGFVAGNELIVKAYADVKDNTDSGQFLAIQEACCYALDHPEQTQHIAAKYSRRMDALVAVLNRNGLPARKPRGSFFLYVKAPTSAVGRDGTRTRFEKAEHFSQWLITEKLISTVPWDDAGGYVRFSVTFIAPTASEEQRVIGEIDGRLGGCKFEF